jgi:dTDP-4-dehydrorhamnose reductase
VNDQRGAPTSSLQLARATLGLLAQGDRGTPITAESLARVRAASGLYHATAAGETTWFGFAREIFATRAKRPGDNYAVPRLIAIPASEYPTPARRPSYSVMSSERLAAAFGVRIGAWRQGLEEALSALPAR